MLYYTVEDVAASRREDYVPNLSDRNSLWNDPFEKDYTGWRSIVDNWTSVLYVGGVRMGAVWRQGFVGGSPPPGQQYSGKFAGKYITPTDDLAEARGQIVALYEDWRRTFGSQAL